MPKFENEGLVSVRANQLVVGESYSMGFNKNPDTHMLVSFLGYYESADENARRVEAPIILREMPQEHVLKVLWINSQGKPETIIVVKDPAGYGAVFTEDAEGTLRRVTFGADPKVLSRLEQEQQKAPVATETTDGQNRDIRVVQTKKRAPTKDEIQRALNPQKFPSTTPLPEAFNAPVRRRGRPPIRARQ